MRNSILFFTIIVFASCSSTYRYIYSASPANSPYFKEKGESKLAAYYSAGDGEDNNQPGNYIHGIDLQGAYAISNHWAITAGYFNRRERDVYDYSDLYNASIVKYKRNLFDIGAGYFLPLNNQKTLTANLYGGWATGKFYFEDNAGSNHYYENGINKWFIQPSINFMPGNSVRLSLAGKVSFVHYGKTRTTYKDDELAYFSLQTLENRMLTFFEPSFNFQFGLPKLPWIKLEMVFSSASKNKVEEHLISNEQVEDSRLRVRGSNASLGLSFDFSKMKKKK